MIVKSMSRKVPSFGQLIGYIDRDEGQEEWRLRHNVFARDPELIRGEFEQNAELLQKRKNGVYLYHEIISITRAKGLPEEEQMRLLHDIAQTYIDARCPDNLVFGNLHKDKEHSYHYHLMISANRAGDTKRLRLSKAQFREAQVQLERHVLETYPELEQKVAIDKRSDRGRTKGEAELERRTGQRPKREEVLERIAAAFDGSSDRQSLLDALGREGLELYVRGQNLGVIDHESGKRHRLKTLDAEMADRVAIRMEDAERDVEEPEVVHEPEQQEPQHEERVVEDVSPEPPAEPEGEKEKEPEEKTKTRRRSRKDQTKKHERKQKKQETRREEKRPKETERQAKPSRKRQNKQHNKQHSREEDVSGPVTPGKGRREMIDKGHVEPDPARDLLTHEEWKQQESFFTKVKQSVLRTYDDVTGRTKYLEEKAQGFARPEPEKPTPEPEKKTERKAEQKRDAEAERSKAQEKWRADISRSRGAGRDDSDRGRD